jgi:WD40 repeat protein
MAVTAQRSWRRLLAGPLAQRGLPALALIAAWTWWAVTPQPQLRWAIPATRFDRCRLLPDGRTLALEPAKWIPGRPCTELVQFWDLTSGHPLGSLPASDPAEYIAAIAPDNSWLIAIERTNLRVLDGATGAVRVWTCPEKYVLAPGGRTMAVYGEDRRPVTLWDLTAGRKIADLGVRSSVTFSRDGRFVAACDGLTRSEYPEEMRRLGPPYEQRLTPPPGERVYVRVWEATTGQMVAELPVPLPDRYPHLAFSPDGRQLALYWSRPGTKVLGEAVVHLWPIGAAEVAAEIRLPTDYFYFTEYRNPPVPFEFSPDGRFLALRPGGIKGTVLDVSRTPPRRLDRLLENDHKQLILPSTCILVVVASPYPAFSPDGRWLLVPGEPGTLELRPTADVSRRTVVPLRRPDNETEPLFSPGGKLLAVALGHEDQEGTPLEQWLNHRTGFPPLPRHRFKVQLFDTDTGAERAAWTVCGSFRGQVLGFGPDGRSVWTEAHVTEDVWKRDVRVLELWPASGWPPLWLVGLSALGVLLAVADGWRARRRRTATAGGGA